MRRAAELAQVDRRIVYSWRSEDREFREAWDEAKEDAIDRVENTLYDMATNGKNVVATIFYLKGNRAHYRDNLRIDVNALHREIEELLSASNQTEARSIAVNEEER